MNTRVSFFFIVFISPTVAAAAAADTRARLGRYRVKIHKTAELRTARRPILSLGSTPHPPHPLVVVVVVVLLFYFRPFFPFRRPYRTAKNIAQNSKYEFSNVTVYIGPPSGYATMMIICLQYNNILHKNMARAVDIFFAAVFVFKTET